MALRFFVYGLILVSMVACNGEPRTFTSSQNLQKEAPGTGIEKCCDAKDHAIVNLTAKFDDTPLQGNRNMGVAYFRVDISNPTDHALSVGAVYVQFEDDMEISIRQCKLQGADIKPFGYTPIRVEPGEAFRASSSCEFPISQMDLVKEVVSLVDFQLMEQRD
jgi:hypothetical protein